MSDGGRQFDYRSTVLIFNNLMNYFLIINYFLKKSGILIDCSFTLLVGVLGVSSVGVVPPTGLLTVGPFELSFAAVPKSILGAVCGCA